MLTAANETRHVPGQKSLYTGPKVSLPKLKLPKLNEEVIQWCFFKNMYSSLVHNYQSITNIELFQFF